MSSSTERTIQWRAERAMSRQARIFNPVFEVDGLRVVLSTAQRASMPAAAMGARGTSPASHRDEIVRALDFLIAGV